MPSSQVKADTIDGVILRLLGIKPGTELDYETYFNLIKKRLATARIANKSFSPEEDQLLRAELKRAQKAKSSGARFRVKEGRARVSSAPKGAPKRKVETQKLLPSKGALIKAPTNKLAPKDISKVEPVKVRDVTPKNPIDSLRGPLDSIFSILQSRFKFDQKQKEAKRKEEETEKRGKRESSLEGFKKGISEIVAATKKMLAPFEDVINRIKRFIFFTLLGRAFTGFMDWMKDKGNQEKFNSFVEFLSKHWPALAGLYILFGTSLGKVVRGVVKLAARMVVALAMMIPKLFSFIRKNKKLSAVGFALGAYASGRVAEMLNSKEAPEAATLAKPTDDLSNVKTDIDKVKETSAPKLNTFNLGGLVPKFAAGGINPFGGMDFASGVPIQGAGKDDTLIAAKTGEAILTEKDQADISKRYVDRETGQPLNIPQYLAGRKPGQVPFSNLRFPTLGGGFFKGGTIPQFNQGGLVGLKRLGKTPGRAWSPLESVIGNAQQRLLNRQAERNTTYFNPFADIFAKPRWNERLPGFNPEIRRYNMPGYNQNKWLELDQFRSTTPSGPRGGWEKKEGRLRYAPWYQQPGSLRPLALKAGGEVPRQPAAGRIPVLRLGSKISGNPNHQYDPVLAKSIPILYRLLQSGRFAQKGWGDKRFLNQLTSRLLVESANFTRTKEMYNPDPRDPKGKGGYYYFGQNYGNRSDLGNRGFDDGYNFRGRGAIQLTGRVHYEQFNKWLQRNGYKGINVVKNPDLLATDPRIQALSTLYYLEDREKITGISFADLAKRGDTRAFTYNINGGYNHLEETQENLRRIQALSKSIDYGTGITNRPATKPKPGNLTITDRIGRFAGGIGENIRNLFGAFRAKGKQDGGLIKENTGKNIMGATADRQLTALQPGEFVVTKRAASVPGVLPALENLNRVFDSNSAAYLGRSSVRMPQITPPMTRSSMPNIMELPPIMTSAGGALRPRASGLGGGSQVPLFSVVAPDNERDKNASIYGLVG